MSSSTQSVKTIDFYFYFNRRVPSIFKFIVWNTVQLCCYIRNYKIILCYYQNLSEELPFLRLEMWLILLHKLFVWCVCNGNYGNYGNLHFLGILYNIYIAFLTWDRIYQSLIPARVSIYLRIENYFWLNLCSLQNTERAIPENIRCLLKHSFKL